MMFASEDELNGLKELSVGALPSANGSGLTVPMASIVPRARSPILPSCGPANMNYGAWR